MVRAMKQHVIIAGFGPIGRVLADALNERQTPSTVIELNAKTVSRQLALGRAIVHGDATRAEVLESAGIYEATAIVFTFPDLAAVLRGCELVRSMAPNAVIAVRTRHLSEALQARQLGAHITVVEEIVGADAMATAVTSALKARARSGDGCTVSRVSNPTEALSPTPSSRDSVGHSRASLSVGTRQGTCQN